MKRKTQEMRDKVFSEDPFMLKYCQDRYETHTNGVDDFPPSLKCGADWFVTRKVNKSFILLYKQMIIYLLLMKILVISHFVAMKWVLLA